MHDDVRLEQRVDEPKPKAPGHASLMEHRTAVGLAERVQVLHEAGDLVLLADDVAERFPYVSGGEVAEIITAGQRTGEQDLGVERFARTAVAWW